VGYPEVVTTARFLERSRKNVILVTLKENSELTVLEGEECHTGASNWIVKLLVKKGYCVVEVVSVSSKKLTAQSFRDIVGKWANTSVTVVFSKFGPWFKGKSGVRCRGVTNSQYHPSFRVLNDAEHYEQLYLEAGNPAAVMLRCEHVLGHTRQFNLSKCLHDVLGVTRRVQGNTHNRIPMVALDFGRYGSNTWQWFIADNATKAAGKRMAKEMLQVLLHNKMSFEEWEGTFSVATGNNTNPGYVAAVQRAIASRAKCLILMGGGDFQESVLRDYLTIHFKEETLCVHLICVDNKKQLQDLITPP